mmetsp:Transcript_43646/g.144509  ORF Transcript_43646/g.144509 Transcript_43646/m.144509 type:complete len:201 (-) Transcript_43646:829-1431(-)
MCRPPPPPLQPLSPSAMRAPPPQVPSASPATQETLRWQTPLSAESPFLSLLYMRITEKRTPPPFVLALCSGLSRSRGSEYGEGENSARAARPRGLLLFSVLASSTTSRLPRPVSLSNQVRMSPRHLGWLGSRKSSPSAFRKEAQLYSSKPCCCITDSLRMQTSASERFISRRKRAVPLLRVMTQFEAVEPVPSSAPSPRP